MIVVAAQYFGKPGSAATVGAALKRMAVLVRENEPACLKFEVSQALDQPDDWLLYEVYLDDTALEVHRDSDHFRAIILQTVLPLLERREPKVYQLVVG